MFLWCTSKVTLTYSLLVFLIRFCTSSVVVAQDSSMLVDLPKVHSPLASISPT